MTFKHNISKKRLKAFILLFPFLPIGALDFGSIYDILMIADIVYIIALYLKSNRKPHKNVMLLGLYMIWLVICCILNGKNPFPGFYYGGKLLTFALINEYYLENKSDDMLVVTRKYMSFLIVVTTFFQIVRQGLFGVMESSGNYKNFFASDNELGYYYIAFIALCIVLDMMKGKKICRNTFVMIAICTISLYKADAGKSTVGIALILFYVLFVFGRKYAKVLSYWRIVGIYAFVFVGIVFFNIQDRFSTLLEMYLHKDVTLTGRTYIWQSSIQNIKASPFYGYGVNNGGRLHTSTNLHGTLVSSHNMFLEVLLQVGIIGMILFCAFLLFSLYQNTKGENQKFINIYYMLLFFSFVILIMYITTPSIYMVFAYIPIILCSQLERIIGMISFEERKVISGD